MLGGVPPWCDPRRRKRGMQALDSIHYCVHLPIFSLVHAVTTRSPDSILGHVMTSLDMIPCATL